MFVEVVVHDWEGWLAGVSNKTLPGGVAVGALVAAMGAALAAKALRVTLSRGGLSAKDQQTFEAAAAAAREAQVTLVGLAEADEAAFRRLLAAGKGPAEDDGRRQERVEAWDMAIEVPIRVSETCRDLAARLSPLHRSCSSVVLVDLEIGKSLLLAGTDAGLRAARANIEQWKAERQSNPTPGTLARRLQALEQEIDRV
jgi:formiminotetrahydrofolate cyclodeaminase